MVLKEEYQFLQVIKQLSLPRPAPMRSDSEEQKQEAAGSVGAGALL